MLRATQNIKQAQREPQSAPSQPAGIGGTIAGCRSRRCEIRRIVANPGSASVRYADLRVGTVIGTAAPLPAVILTRRSRSGDDFGANRPPLRLVAVEQALPRCALYDKRQLPGEVVGVLDAGIHPLAAGRRVDMSGVAGNKDAAFAVMFGEPHADPEG